MPTMALSFPALMRRLKSAGVDTAYVKKTVLPDWWEASLAKAETGYAEAAGYIAQRMGIDIESLFNPTAPIVPLPSIRPNFKVAEGRADKDLNVASAVATRLADVAVDACPVQIGALPDSAASARAEIIGGGQPCVTFENLLDFCWFKGVVVLSVTRFPGKKPDGMAMMVGERPVIILSRLAAHPAWSAFDLAHELGHLALGHVQVNVAVMDASLLALDTDQEEHEANDFAAELLTGSPDTRFKSDFRLRGERLAAAAKDLGRHKCVDPGVIVLNYARTMQNQGLECWGAAQNALKLIPRSAEPHALMREFMLARLDFDRMSRETRSWLLRATEADGNRARGHRHPD